MTQFYYFQGHINLSSVAKKHDLSFIHLPIQGQTKQTMVQDQVISDKEIMFSVALFCLFVCLLATLCKKF